MSLTYASVTKLRKVCDPFRQVCWSDDLDAPLTREEVLAATPTPPKEQYQKWPPVPCSREEHAGRIRWFMENESWEPISIDVGIPGLGCHVDWPITDGNHRFAAAILLGRKRIAAEFSGDTRFFKQYRP